MKKNQIVQEIKNNYDISNMKYTFMCAYLISVRLSPYVSKIYINKGIKPNRITLHMIFSGIIGAVLFSMPNVYIKIVGVFFIQLWFILDCSDGEVARYTKTFSKYGKELDYMAHLIDHPLFGISLFLSLLQFNRYNAYFLAFAIFASNFLDYLNRNLLTLDLVVKLKENKNERINKKTTLLKKRILLVTNIFTLYPNLVLFGVIIYFIDYVFESNILVDYICINVIVTFLFTVRFLILQTKNFYLS